jgi:hypothetical protein
MVMKVRLHTLSSFPSFQCADLAAYTDSLTSLPLGKKANKAAALKMRQEMGEMIDDVGMEVEEEDDEQREWEAAQIRRAGGERVKRDEGKNGKEGKKPYRAAPSTFFPFSLLRSSFSNIKPSPPPQFHSPPLYLPLPPPSPASPPPSPTSKPPTPPTLLPSPTSPGSEKTSTDKSGN